MRHNGLAVWFCKPTTPLQSDNKLSKAYKLYRLLAVCKIYVMKTPYIISELKDGKFAVHNPHPDAMEWECVSSIEEAKEKFQQKNKEYLEFVNRMQGE